MAFDREARNLQQVIRAAVCNVGGKKPKFVCGCA